MKFKAKTVIVVILLIASAGAAFFFLKASPVRLTAHGLLQDGRKYQATCEMVPSSFFALGSKRSYTIRSLDFSTEGKSRKVPGNALHDIVGINPQRPLQVSEEGPVIVISMHAGKNDHPVQWRYLNGFFAQRRILNGKQVAIHDAKATLKAPTMVSNVSPDAPRRLGSPSLLSTPDEAPSEATQNSHE
jgi:hypothetical protein